MRPGLKTTCLAAATLVATTLLHVSVSHAVVKTFLVHLDGAQERPTPVATAATGSGNIEVDTDANTIKVKVSYQNLSAGETGAHIHGPAIRSATAGVVFPLTAGQVKVQTINYSGHAMPDSVDAWLLSGRMYINIHSVSHTGGEIRGQIDDDQPSPAGSVPALGTWGAAALALGLLFGSGLWMRRRRMAVA